MDVGGSLNYRARGELKTDFGEIVNELTSLIENNGCYTSMKKADILQSLKHVTEIPDEQIWKIIEDSPSDDYSLGAKLIARRDFMKKFAEILEKTDETQFEHTIDLVNYVKLKANNEFDSNSNIAALLGYIQTKTGFEGLLNTRSLDELNLKPEQREIAEQMLAEIEKFTKQNRIADSVNLPKEVKDFLNSILQGIPEFAPFFGKPQHSIQKYSLDIHILKVLQDSMNDPLYKQLDDQDKIVLKFSTLLHDIGKRYLTDGSDTGHAAKSAEYVYSILDRFNLSDDLKDRIIATVENHHWFKAYNEGFIDAETVATLCRRPQDFLIYRIMAKADLANINDNFPIEKIKGAHSLKHAWELYDKQMEELELKVNELSQKQVVVTSSKFVDIPKLPRAIKTLDGKIITSRTFPRQKATVGGVETEFRVLNWKDLTPNTNMFQYGFNNILLKDVKLLVHMTEEYSGISALNIFNTLAKNPMNYSAQSISMITLADKATYSGREFGLLLDVNSANISHAYYSNTGSGTKKGLKQFVYEMFETGSHRSFVKDQFVEYMKTQKGITLDDSEYGAIAKVLLKKQYPETQLKDKIIKINGKEYKGQDILEAFLYSRDQLNSMKKQKAHGSHNELVGLNSKVKGLVAKVDKLEDCPEYFLQFAKENDLPIILVGKDG